MALFTRDKLEGGFIERLIAQVLGDHCRNFEGTFGGEKLASESGSGGGLLACFALKLSRVPSQSPKI